MPIRITVRDATTGNKVEMELEPDSTVDEVIESAASYWGKDSGAYIMRYGKKLLTGKSVLADIELQAGDTLEIIPDPEGGSVCNSPHIFHNSSHKFYNSSHRYYKYYYTVDRWANTLRLWVL
jgi:molybdopterin converting factor small subunit